MCRFRLQCPQDKSDIEGGASPAAPGNHRGGRRVTGPAQKSWGLSRVPPSASDPLPLWVAWKCMAGGSRKGLTWGSLWNRSAPQIRRVTAGHTEVPREPGI